MDQRANNYRFNTLINQLGFAGYGVAAVALGGVGYFVHNVEQRQTELLKERKEVLLANRERRLTQDA